jgi:hypothetical protein
MSEEEYYYNNEPLQLSYRNTYTAAEKIEIVLKLQKIMSLEWCRMLKCVGS